MIEGGLFDEVLCFGPRQAPYVAERSWHPQQQITETADGGLVIGFPATSLFEVKRWVLAWGSEATALEPPKLVTEVKEELEKALNNYNI